MLKISRLADYGTVILACLADSGEQCLSAQQLATTTHLPIPTVSKLLKLLNEAGLVSSTRGPSGGYQLSRPSEQISLAEIIYAIDGPLAVTACSKGLEHCDWNAFCGLQHNWQYINKMINELLQQFTLHDMSQPLKKVMVLNNSLDE